MYEEVICQFGQAECGNAHRHVKDDEVCTRFLYSGSIRFIDRPLASHVLVGLLVYYLACYSFAKMYFCVIAGWQPRWFVLDNGILSYYDSQDDVCKGSKGSIKMAVCEIKGKFCPFRKDNKSIEVNMYEEKKRREKQIFQCMFLWCRKP